MQVSTARAGAPSTTSRITPAIRQHSNYAIFSDLQAAGKAGARTSTSVRAPADRPGALWWGPGQQRHRQAGTFVRPLRAGAYNSDSDDEDNYYAVLGVPVTASKDEIKRAYYGYMKELHPDVSMSRDSSDSDDDTSLQHDMAVFMNEVYDTLSDPDRRAAYDEIVGLSAQGINPFRDTTYEADKVFVDEYTCIGCRNCANVCSKTFFIEEEHGRARAIAQGVDSDEKLQEAIDTCPVSCIYWVSAPQLTLLEDEMRRMERKAAWLLMNGGGSAVNVFLEASNAWEKRRSLARARAYAAGSGAATRRNFWESWAPSASASSYGASATDDEEAEEEGSTDGANKADVRRKTAASVAAAARKWRDLRRVQRKRRDADRTVLMIPASSSVDDA